MSISAKLFVDDQEFNILEYNLNFSQETDGSKRPIGNFKGGHFNLKVETIKSSLLLQWMLNSDSMKKVKIVFPSRTGRTQSRTIELLDTYCVENNKAFNALNPEPLTTNITLSPASMIENGEVMFSKSWRVTDPTPKERKPAEDTDKEKKLIITFEANNTDVKNGVFGFDEIPKNYKKICDSNITLLENEYNPIQVYNEQYFPVWISMRKGQKITLNLDVLKQKNEKLFKEIKFEDHSDFTFSPANLIGAKKVTITCNNTNDNTLQLKLLGDNETVGAINFFYPEPKEMNLRWVVVNFNEGDKATIDVKVKIQNLNDYFKTALNAALIDINIVNKKYEILDFTQQVTNISEKAFLERIKTNLANGSKDNIKQTDSNKINFLGSLHSLHLKRENRTQENEVTLYLTNLKSSSSTESATTDGENINLYNNGITVENISMMFLKNEKMNTKGEIPHEVMHALGLPHSFKQEGNIQKHTFKPKTTKNYMDYSDQKESTWKWQWEILH